MNILRIGIFFATMAVCGVASAQNNAGGDNGGGQQPNAGGNQSQECVAAQNAVADAKAQANDAALMEATWPIDKACAIALTFNLPIPEDCAKGLAAWVTNKSLQTKIPQLEADAKRICNTPTKTTSVIPPPPPPPAPVNPNNGSGGQQPGNQGNGQQAGNQGGGGLTPVGGGLAPVGGGGLAPVW
jgi:hypothetical protein